MWRQRAGRRADALGRDQVWFGILGALLVHDGTEVISVPAARQRVLLAALLTQAGQAVSADALAELVWDGSPPSGAAVTLRSHVLRLRRVLGPRAGARLVTRYPGYLLQAGEDEVDVLRFRCLCQDGGIALREGAWDRADGLLGEALGLWRGAPLADVPSERLLRQEVPGLEELRLQTAEWRIDAALHLGRHDELVYELQPLTAQHPLRERFHSQLMLALYRCGRQAEALAVFQDTRHLLVEQLGIEPGPNMQRLNEQILAMDPALDLDAPAAPVTGQVTTDRAQQPLDTAVRELATAVTRQWTAEAVMRSLGRPEPIQLHWSSTHRTAALAASAMVRRESGTGHPEPLNLHGGLSDLVAKFRQLPKQQLVVLGEPGSGKTALAVLMTLGLLSAPEPRDPVPVLLPLSSWDPRNEHLYTWLASKLTQEYPGLGNAAVYGPHAAKRLVADGRVLPVLDGLDEMPPELQAAAIDAIDQATAGGRPLVVTCRSAEYEEAVLRGGAILAAAAVVEMEPVDLEDATRFLTARQPLGDSRWQPVVEHLRRHPEGPLAHVMSTPLMLDLARTAYSGPASDPAELSDAVRFPDRASIEEHLLGTFLPTAYPRQLPPPTPAAAIRPVALHHYDPEQAKRWLTFLARHLQRARSRDLAWWQLADAIPSPIRGPLFGLPPALIFAITGELAGGPVIGIVYGVAFALAGWATNSLARPSGPLRVEVRFRGTGPRFLGRFAIGLVIGVGLGLGWSLSPGLVLVIVLVFGLALGVQVWLATPADVDRVSSPSIVLRQERVAATSFTLSFALSLGTFYAVADAFTKQIEFVPILGGSFDIADALAAGVAGALLGRFAFGRPGSVAYGLATAVMGGVVYPRASTIPAGFLTGIMFGIAVGLTIFLSRAWGSFILTRIWFAARGQTPLRLMRFLADAHRRAVLRQVGAVYQFRHASLQDNLAKPVS
jgi:DNA-binding SARP family transcriptional activator